MRKKPLSERKTVPLTCNETEARAQEVALTAAQMHISTAEFVRRAIAEKMKLSAPARCVVCGDAMEREGVCQACLQWESHQPIDVDYAPVGFIEA